MIGGRKRWSTAIADLNAKVLRIVEILEAEFGGEQGLSEDDA